MFFRRNLDKKPYFRGVALVTILAGAAVLALGLVELGINLWGDGGYVLPTGKIIGGLVVLSLGYIHLELEQLRIK